MSSPSTATFYLYKDKFQKNNKKKKNEIKILYECRIVIDDDSMLLLNPDSSSSRDSIKSIKSEDICGCRKLEEVELLRIFIYQKSNSIKNGRKQSTLLLGPSASTSSDHLNELQCNIDKAIAKDQSKKYTLSLLNPIKTSDNSNTTRSSCDKPFLVFINPNSGKGKAQKLFNKYVAPIWDNETSLFSFSYKLVLTSEYFM